MIMNRFNNTLRSGLRRQMGHPKGKICSSR